MARNDRWRFHHMYSSTFDTFMLLYVDIYCKRIFCLDVDLQIYKFFILNEGRKNWKTTDGICVDCFFVDNIIFGRRYRRWSLEMFRDLRNTYRVIDYIHFLSSFSRFSSNRTFRRWKVTSGPFNSRVHLLASSFLSFFLWHTSLSSIWYSEYFLLYPRAKRSILVSCSKLRVLQSFSSSISYRFFFTFADVPTRREM